MQKKVDLVTEVLESEKLPSLEDNDVKTIEGNITFDAYVYAVKMKLSYMILIFL